MFRVCERRDRIHRRSTEPTYRHQELAAGRWRRLSLAEQFGNVGIEVGRMRCWCGKDERLAAGAFDRALELLDLTPADLRWRGRLKEIARAREPLCDAALCGREHGTTLEDLDRYFLEFGTPLDPSGSVTEYVQARVIGRLRGKPEIRNSRRKGKLEIRSPNPETHSNDRKAEIQIRLVGKWSWDRSPAPRFANCFFGLRICFGFRVSLELYSCDDHVIGQGKRKVGTLTITRKTDAHETEGH